MDPYLLFSESDELRSDLNQFSQDARKAVRNPRLIVGLDGLGIIAVPRNPRPGAHAAYFPFWRSRNPISLAPAQEATFASSDYILVTAPGRYLLHVRALSSPIPVDPDLTSIQITGSSDWIGTDPDGAVWIGRVPTGVTRAAATRIHPPGAVRAAIATHNFFVVGTTQGVYAYDARGELLDFLPDHRVNWTHAVDTDTVLVIAGNTEDFARIGTDGKLRLDMRPELPTPLWIVGENRLSYADQPCNRGIVWPPVSTNDAGPLRSFLYLTPATAKAGAACVYWARLRR